MQKYLLHLIDRGDYLLTMHQHESFSDSVDDEFLEIATKSKLFFNKLNDDPLSLKAEFEKINLEWFDEENLFELLILLKKANCYFEKPTEESEKFWDYIHPLIRGICKSKFDHGYYADAVETALKEVNDIIKKRYKSESGKELDGAILMNTVFSVNNPVYKFADVTEETGKSIQLGYMQIFAGAMTGIRNPKAHANMKPSKEITIHLLFIASFMTLKIDQLGLI